MTLDAKQAQTMVLDLDCGEVAFVRSNAADEITLRFENFYSDWLERTVDESGFSVRYKIPKGYISGSDPTPTLSIAGCNACPGQCRAWHRAGRVRDD